MGANVKEVTEALETLAEELKWRDSVSTSFGKQSPAYGYDIQDISLQSGHAVVTLHMHDRAVHEADDCTRGGDAATIHVVKDKIFDEKEWEIFCLSREQAEEFTEPERLAALKAPQTMRFTEANGYDLFATIACMGEDNAGKRLYQTSVNLYSGYDSENSTLLQQRNFVGDEFNTCARMMKMVDGGLTEEYCKSSREHREEFAKQTEETIHTLLHSLWANAEQEQFPSAYAVMEDRFGYLIRVEMSEEENGYSLRADCNLDGKRHCDVQFFANETNSILDKLREIASGTMTAHYLLEAENKELNSRMAKTQEGKEW